MEEGSQQSCAGAGLGQVMSVSSVEPCGNFGCADHCYFPVMLDPWPMHSGMPGGHRDSGRSQHGWQKSSHCPFFNYPFQPCSSFPCPVWSLGMKGSPTKVNSKTPHVQKKCSCCLELQSGSSRSALASAGKRLSKYAIFEVCEPKYNIKVFWHNFKSQMHSNIAICVSAKDSIKASNMYFNSCSFVPCFTGDILHVQGLARSMHYVESKQLPGPSTSKTLKSFFFPEH